MYEKIITSRRNRLRYLRKNNYMYKLKFLITATLTLILFYSCERSAKHVNGEVLNEINNETLENRIMEIKEFYKEIQKYDTQEKKCTTKTKITYDELSRSFENSANECILQDNFMYRSIDINSWELAETCRFYFKNDRLFFTFLRGGDSCSSYEYRIYYDRDGKVIRVLLEQDNCDDDSKSSSREVLDLSTKREILRSVENARKEFQQIL